MRSILVDRLVENRTKEGQKRILKKELTRIKTRIRLVENRIDSYIKELLTFSEEEPEVELQLHAKMYKKVEKVIKLEEFYKIEYQSILALILELKP